MVKELAEIEGREWAEYGKSRKPISTNQLAKLLRLFNVLPRTVKFLDGKTAKGYHREMFDEVFERYTRPLFPVKRFWYSRIRFKYGKWWWRNKLDSTKGSFRWLQGQYILLKNLRLLGSGKPLGWLQMLLHEAYEKNQNDRWATTSWSGLEKKRGKWIRQSNRGFPNCCLRPIGRYFPILS